MPAYCLIRAAGRSGISQAAHLENTEETAAKGARGDGGGGAAGEAAPPLWRLGLEHHPPPRGSDRLC
jgi:hypothetical protein